MRTPGQVSSSLAISSTRGAARDTIRCYPWLSTNERGDAPAPNEHPTGAHAPPVTHRMERGARGSPQGTMTVGSPGRQLRPHRSSFILERMVDERAHELLARERARIEQALADLAPPDRDDPEPFDDDVAPDLLEAEIEEGLRQRLQDELAAVERAERRLADGTYGLSIESGEPIPDGRLEAIPWAERTVEEQARYDAMGA
jgi:DnaK suppressor protein